MPPGSERDVTLVLGGVRSGKSKFAQRLAMHADRVTFIATAEPRDDEEMRRKIERHRSERPEYWKTIEEPLDLAGAIGVASACDLILIDCLTLFAGKLLEVYESDTVGIAGRVDALCDALSSTSSPIVIVSNEVGSGVVPAFEMGRRYRDLLGEINQRAAAIADHVVLMIAGLPLALKGPLRKEVTS